MGWEGDAMNAAEHRNRFTVAPRPRRFGGLLAVLFAGLLAFHPHATQALEVTVSGGVSTERSASVQTNLGTTTATQQTVVSGSATVSDTGVTAEGQIGFAAQLEAVSKQYTAGSENLNVSGQVSGSVEFLAGAEAKVGAYIDEKGIHIGAEGSAGAYVSAAISADFEAEIFGVKTQVHAYAEGSAGIMAEGEASVTIGFDGKVEFVLGAGVVVGIGGSVGVEFSMDISELMAKLGLTELEQLANWIADFAKDPKGTLQDLLADATDALLAETLENVAAYLEEKGKAVGAFWSRIWDGGGFTSPPDLPASSLPDTAAGGSGQVLPSVSQLPGGSAIPESRLPKGIALPASTSLPDVPDLPQVSLPYVPPLPQFTLPDVPSLPHVELP